MLEIIQVPTRVRVSASAKVGGAFRLLSLAAIVAGGPTPMPAQEVIREDEVIQMDALVAFALEASPTVAAAHARIEAARSAIAPAGAFPDPMFSLGVANLPVTEPGFDDFMTMKMVGLGQTIPFPGKLLLRRRVMEEDLSAAEIDLEAARLAVREQVQRAYYELVFVDRAMEIVQADGRLLGNILKITEAQYGTGTGRQEDVIEARIEMARLAGEAVALSERRMSVLARLNATLDRPTETPVHDPSLPERIVRAAVAGDISQVRFVSTTLGSRAADSPLPPLVAIQERAVQQSPVLRSHQATIRAQALRVELAQREHLPDFDVSVQYGQRSGYTDMISVMVSVPIPLRRGERQDHVLRESEAVLATLQAEHRERANAVRAEVAAAYADLERERARLALFATLILPQGREVLESSTASYQAGGGDLLALLEHQAAIYRYESEFHRTLIDFAIRSAELERIVGGEILP